jgi:pimeloyl-ACP methyl ester carboxylesterase
MTNSTTKITRWQFGTGAAAGAVGLAGMTEPLHADQMQKTFILVHGAWHGGWCWRRVADLLQAQGHKVFTPTLTGLGEKSHLRQDETGLDTHVTDILNLIEWEDLSDIVLVGHSYGGMVITGVANALADKIEAIVYLDAFKPDEGDSVASMADPKTSAYMHKLWDDGTRAWGPLPVDYFSVLPETLTG